jgi:hypothetical protein
MHWCITRSPHGTNPLKVHCKCPNAKNLGSFRRKIRWSPIGIISMAYPRIEAEEWRWAPRTLLENGPEMRPPQTRMLKWIYPQKVCSNSERSCNPVPRLPTLAPHVYRCRQPLGHSFRPSHIHVRRNQISNHRQRNREQANWRLRKRSRKVLCAHT